MDYKNIVTMGLCPMLRALFFGMAALSASDAAAQTTCREDARAGAAFARMRDTGMSEKSATDPVLRMLKPDDWARTITLLRIAYRNPNASPDYVSELILKECATGR